MSNCENAREYICICKKVSLSFIEESFLKAPSNHFLQEIIKITKATKGCGACVAEVKQIIDQYLKEYPDLLLRLNQSNTNQNFLFE